MKEKKILFSLFTYRRYTDTFRWIFPLCLCIVFLSITSETYAIDYYVSASGNDANSGTLSSPFKTITRGIVKLKGGDILFVRTGTYVESLNIQQSGTESLPITITAYPGDHPVLDGQGQYWGYLVYLGGNYIHISGFEVKNNNTNGTHTGGYGVYLGGHHNKVSNLNVHHIWENGILASGDYSIVEDCQIWQCAFSNSISPGSGGWSSGLSAARDKVDGITDNAILRRNTVYENWGEGLSAFEAIGTIIEDNRVYDNWSVNIYISDATHTLVQRNIIYRTKDMTGGSQVGILLGDERFTPPSSNNTIINNIVYGCRRNFMSGGMTNNVISNNTFMNSTNVACVQVYNETMVNSSFVNNIIIQEDGLAITNGFAANANFHVNHNLWSKTPVAGASGVGDIIGNAQITKAGSLGSNLAAAYFKLLENSPAINKGIVGSNVTQDYFGNSRDATPDIGAYEYLIVTQANQTTTKPLGNTDVYSSIDMDAYRRAIPITFTEAGNIASISIYHGAGTGSLLLGIYADQSGSPSSLLGVTPSTAVSGTTGWQTVSLTSPVAVTSGQTVWLSYVFQTNPGVRYTAGTPARALATTAWAGGMPATFGAATFANYKFSLYCTYTPGSTGPFLNVSPASVSLGSASGSNGTFTITSNTTWSISDDGSWLDVSPASGTNNGTITVTANSANTGTSSRSATVTIVGTGVTPNKTVTVTQQFQSGGSKTLGNTAVFGSITNDVNRRALPFTMTENGVIQSISMYHSGNTNGSHLLLAVYSDASGAPSALLGVTPVTVINTTQGWQTVSLTNPVSATAGQKIWLSWVFENNPGIRWQSGTPGRANSAATWSGGMPASFGASTQADYTYSIYANYTTSTSSSKSTNNQPEVKGDVVIDEPVLIYPNPTNGKLTVEWNGEHENGLILSVYNTNGEIVKNLRIEQDVREIQLDLGETIPGLYLILIKDVKTSTIINNSKILKN